MLRGLFVLEEPFLGVDSSGETRELSRAPDEAVTRDDDRDGVAPGGCTDGACGARFVEVLGELAIALGLPERDLVERIPCLLYTSDAADE